MSHQIQLLSCKPYEPGQVDPALMHISQRTPRQCNWFYLPSTQPTSEATKIRALQQNLKHEYLNGPENQT